MNQELFNKRRLLFLFGIFLIIFILLVFQLGKYQIIRGEELSELASRRQIIDYEVPPARGVIYDRNMRELAVNITTNIIYANTNNIRNKKDTAYLLSEALDLEYEDLLYRLENADGTIVIKRFVSRDVGEEIRKLSLPGVWVVEDQKRHYPFDNLASYVIGHTDYDNNGSYGVELYYDQYLQGVPGRAINLVDGRRIPFQTKEYFPTQKGNDIVLTIDETIQHFAERIALEALEEQDAKRVKVIVMDVETAEILAFTSKPDYNINYPREVDEELWIEFIEDYHNQLNRDLEENSDSYDYSFDNLTAQEQLNFLFSMWRNPIINDAYEPGSTFKPFTAAAALEEGTTNLERRYDSTAGYIVVNGVTIRSWRWREPFGVQNLYEAMRNSDNPVFVQIVQELEREYFYRYLNAFGFTDRTNIDLPGEARGSVINENNVRDLELATMSFGQSLTLTPIQLITAYTTFANGGYLQEPRVVKEIIDENGNNIFEKDAEIRQVISKETADDMMDILRFATDNTIVTRHSEGYSVAGKTATAQKLENGVYSKDKYIASFAGLAPADDPKIAVLFMVDEPSAGEFQGGPVAGPYSGRLIAEILKYYRIEVE